MKVYIAIPSCRDWKAHFGASLCGLVRQMTLDGVDFNLNAMMGTSVLPKARQMAMEHAIAGGYTHILFLDDDMAFEQTAFKQLASRKLPVVGANYSNKNPHRTAPQTHGLDGNPVSSIGKSDAQEVGWIGFGLILIELSIMAEIPKPWFEMRWFPERQSFIGEDYYFCAKVRSHGHSVNVDHAVKTAHVGDYPYQE